jgi:hypothetical protein
MQLYFLCLRSRRAKSVTVNLAKNLWNYGSTSGPENREYGRRDLSRWPRGTLYPQKFALTSTTSGGRSVGIVCSRTKATELVMARLVHITSWHSNIKEPLYIFLLC